MTLHDAPTLTRRGVVRTAAWSAPAIAVLSAAPAFASSGVKLLTISDAGSTYKGVNSGALSCTVSTTGQVASGTLTVTVTARANGASAPVTTTSTPPGWTVSAPSPTTVVFTYAGAIAGGQSVALSATVTSTALFASFTALAQAPSYTSSSFVLAAPSGPPTDPIGI
ncbi:hypothetical protein K8Z61_00710 [Nocardioides sp. TRM66260-LWL]|uniref:hypothetical protein n=1 Tax=Nocardioides sp. TRM66260-LWL TaxID=2874478 RepID=UPI001CC77005|nr:hypothetical protein [Nocardioides sp. TRM66260-LWL]MBZ5733005.1 hypothetical protein [Nocardioides sp. TRM66260-LWL]